MNNLYKTEKSAVTIAIGFLCKDSIHLAADSQTTRGKVKSMTAHKVHVVKLKDSEVLVAEAGYVDYSSKALQVLERICQGKSLTADDTFAAAMQDAMFEVRKEIRRQRFNCNSETLNEYLRWHEMDCGLMAAHYFNGTPYVYQASLSTGVASIVAGGNGEVYFTAIGSGAELALYLLEELSHAGMDFNPAFATLVHTIGEVKKHDTYCAGQTRFGFIGSDNHGGMLDQRIVDDVANEIQKYSETERGLRTKRINDMLETVAKKWSEKFKDKL